MLRPRIIPCLLVKDQGLVKTVNFANAKYVGDPLNAVRIFNEKEVDELMVLDIDATSAGRGPDYTMIQHLAAECRMPLCYGGGIHTVEQARRVFALGVEKVAISSAAVETPGLITAIADQVGNQSVAVILDIRKNSRTREYEVWTHNAEKRAQKLAVPFARELEDLGAGEIVLNSIDRDGTMQGYDMELAEAVRAGITVPMTVMGGAGSLKDIGDLIGRFGLIGAAAGSVFVFKGQYRAVLITYPDRSQKDALIETNYRASRQYSEGNTGPSLSAA